LSEVVPLHPIPNWIVKRLSADNSCGATCREDRSGPGTLRKIFFLIADNISIRTLCSSDIFESKIQKECGATCREKEVDAGIKQLTLRELFYSKKSFAYWEKVLRSSFFYSKIMIYWRPIGR